MVEGFLDREASFTEKISLTGIAPSFVISISEGHQILSTLNIGERLSLTDARGRPRSMVDSRENSHTRIRIGIEKTIYLQEGSRLIRQKRSALDRHMPESSNYDYDTTSTGLRDSTKSVSSTSNEDIGVGVIPKNNSRHHNSDSIIDSIIIGSVSPQPVDVEVTSGDRLILLKTANNDHFRTNAYEHMIKISCTLPEILHKVQEWHKVFIDDGKIEAVVLSSTNEYLVLSPSDTTAKIKTGKGLTPDSELSLSASLKTSKILVS